MTSIIERVGGWVALGGSSVIERMNLPVPLVSSVSPVWWGVFVRSHLGRYLRGSFALVAVSIAAGLVLVPSAHAAPARSASSTPRGRALGMYRRDRPLRGARHRTWRAQAAIVSGVQASISEIPWQVAIFAEYESEGKEVSSLCGGTLIDLSHVVTAAHCAYDPVTGKALVAASFVVVVGASSITAEEISKGATVQARFVSAVRIHPDYDYSAGAGAADDVAVLGLALPVKETVEVKPALLPSSDVSPETGADLLLSGYGEENPATRELNGNLYAIGTAVEPSRACGGEAEAVFICTSNTGGSACGGDSGGPVERELDGARIVVGVLDDVQIINAERCRAGTMNVSANLTAPEIRDFVQGNEHPPLAPRGGEATLIGEPVVGRVITCVPGGWSNSPTFTYTFVNSGDGSVLQSGQSATFSVREPDLGFKIVCRLEASTEGGTATVGTSPLAAVEPAPFLAPPSAEGSAPQAGAGSAGTGGENWFPAASMGEPRAGHTANLLPDGDVLVAGGYNGFTEDVGGTHTNLSVAELFDPSNDRWGEAPPMLVARSFQTSTSLKEGRVLVVGGWESPGSPEASAEIYSPETNNWTAVPAPTELHEAYAATLLPSGWVFLTGTFGPGSYEAKLGAALYDPVANSWEPAARPKHPRAYPTISLLANGDVLVAGGWTREARFPEPTRYTVQRTVEEYNPNTNAWTELAPMTHPRAYETATLMPNGGVLMTGGIDELQIGGALFSAVSNTEMYDPETNTWTARAPMSLARARHSATLLPDGDVLVAGGGDCGHEYCLGGGRGPANDCCAASSAEVFDPATDAWSFTGPQTTGIEHTATLLPDGDVFVTGGNLEPVATHELNSAEVFAPNYPPDEPSASKEPPSAAAAPPPKIESLSETNRVWRLGGRPARIAAASRHAPVGTSFDITLNEAANLRLTFIRTSPGREVRGRCVAGTHRNRHAHRCSRTHTDAHLSLTGHALRNVIAFQGRVSRTITLTPGSYTVSILASNDAGQSRARELSFTIAK